MHNEMKLFFVDCGLLLATCLPLTIVYRLPPFVRPVYDPAEWYLYAFPHSPDTIPPNAATVFYSLPMLGLLVGTAARRKPGTRRLLAELIIGFAWSAMMTMFPVFVLKYAYGRLRPDFLARCFQDFPDIEIDELPPIPECDSHNEFVLLDGRRSFPSGHAAYMLSSTIFTSLAWLTVVSKTKYRGSFSISLLPILSLVLASLWGAATRTSDFRHHPTDVIGGAIIGIWAGTTSAAYTWYKLQDTPTRQPSQEETKQLLDTDSLYSV